MHFAHVFGLQSSSGSSSSSASAATSSAPPQVCVIFSFISPSIRVINTREQDLDVGMPSPQNMFMQQSRYAR